MIIGQTSFISLIIQKDQDIKTISHKTLKSYRFILNNLNPIMKMKITIKTAIKASRTEVKILRKNHLK